MDISEKLLNLRKAANLTQEALAEKLNVSRQSISKWESGQCVPDTEKLDMLSDILWNMFPGITAPAIILLIATAAAILFYLHCTKKDS